MKMVNAMGSSLMSLLFGMTIAAGPVEADYVFKDGNGSLQTVKAFSCTVSGGGTGICPGYTPQDMTGAALGVSGNPFYVTGTFWPYTLGQQVAGSSVPVVLPATQITALTPPPAITGYALETGGNLANLYGAVGNGASPAANTLQARLAAILGALGKTEVVDGSGNVQNAPLAPTVSTAVESSHVIKASAGQVQGCYAVNTTSVTGYMILLNATSVPADGAVTPLAAVALPANGSASISPALLNPLSFSTGIVAVLTNASTPFTKTTTGGLQGFISCQAI